MRITEVSDTTSVTTAKQNQQFQRNRTQVSHPQHGLPLRAIPKDLPPRSTLHDCLEVWEWSGTLERIHHALYVKCRQ